MPVYSQKSVVVKQIAKTAVKSGAKTSAKAAGKQVAKDAGKEIAEQYTKRLIRREVMENVIRETIPSSLLTPKTKYFINPTGRFVLGGPAADTGLTGRKIIVDTYGGHAHHGGGAFSGKDSTKVDRSASYAARNIAATIVKSGLYKKAEVQLSYAIGVKDPVSIHVDTFGEEKISEEKLIDWIRKEWDLSPKGIIETFSLRSPIFLSTASSGHFGHSEFSWEKIDEKKIESLLSIS